MKRITVPACCLLLACLLCRCTNQENKKPDSQTNALVAPGTILKTDTLERAWTLEVKNVSLGSKLSVTPVVDTAWKNNLPTIFTQRSFISNPGPFRSHIELLVGMVVKKETIDGKRNYTITQDYKTDSAKIAQEVPNGGILVEQVFDQTVGGGITVLLGIGVQKDHAVQFIINDVSQALVTSQKQIDMKRLYGAFGAASDDSLYYLIIAGYTTSITNKDFVTTKLKAGFNNSAVSVGGNYYKENGVFRQDYLVGVVLVPVKDYLRGYTPPKS